MLRREFGRIGDIIDTLPEGDRAVAAALLAELRSLLPPEKPDRYEKEFRLLDACRVDGKLDIGRLEEMLNTVVLTQGTDRDIRSDLEQVLRELLADQAAKQIMADARFYNEAFRSDLNYSLSGGTPRHSTIWFQARHKVQEYCAHPDHPELHHVQDHLLYLVVRRLAHPGDDSVAHLNLRFSERRLLSCSGIETIGELRQQIETGEFAEHKGVGPVRGGNIVDALFKFDQETTAIHDRQ